MLLRFDKNIFVYSEACVESHSICISPGSRNFKSMTSISVRFTTSKSMQRLNFDSDQGSSLNRVEGDVFYLEGTV